MGNALIGFMSGIGDAGVKLGTQHLKAMDDADQIRLRGQEDEKNIRLRADLDEQKERRLQSIKDAPLMRIQGKAQELIGQQVPVEAAPVGKLTGAGTPAYPDGTPSKGLIGDPKALRAQVAAMPDGEDKTNILSQIDRQEAADKAINLSAVEGKTRARTSDEAHAAAVEWAKVNDLPALAAYEQAIGKPMREDRKLDQADSRDVARENREVTRQAAYDKKIDNQEAYNQRREERLDKLAEVQEKRIAAQGDRAETQSQRTAAVELMKSTERELERTMTLAKDPMLDDATKKMFDSRTAALTRDVGRYRKALESFGGDSIPKEADSKPTLQEVRINGKVIGQAATPEEAVKMGREWKASNAKPTASQALIGAPTAEPKAEAPYNPSNPLSVSKANNAAYEREKALRPQLTQAEYEAEAAKEKAKRDAWLKGQ